MTREINGRIRMVVSDDGTRCAAECPAYDGPYEADDKCWKEAPAGATGICTDPRFYGERVDDDSHPYIFDGLRCGACIAAEQAAASVPSCEGAKHVESLATLAMNAENNLAYIRRTFPGGDPRDTDWYAAEVAALVWAHKAAQAAASSGHLDGGARALDASEALRDERLTTWMNAADEAHRALRETHVKLAAAEEALREARVQGMREALSIAKSNAYATVYDTVDWSHVDEVFRAAIEAVRKGER